MRVFCLLVSPVFVSGDWKSPFSQCVYVLTLGVPMLYLQHRRHLLKAQSQKCIKWTVVNYIHWCTHLVATSLDYNIGSPSPCILFFKRIVFKFGKKILCCGKRNISSVHPYLKKNVFLKKMFYPISGMIMHHKNLIIFHAEDHAALVPFKTYYMEVIYNSECISWSCCGVS
jgi:hypothetical protein